MIFYFKELCFNQSWNDYFKMNEIVDKFLLPGHKFTPELHLIKKFKEAGDLNYIYEKELDKACLVMMQ